MKGLILDTGSSCPFLLWVENGLPLSLLCLDSGEKLSAGLGKAIQEFIPHPPDFIAVGQGPGSYTGIRVGVSIAKALSFGWRVPLIGISSLQCFAPIDPPASFAIVMDARMGGLYCQRASLLSDGSLEFLPPEKLSLETALNSLGSIPLYSPESASIGVKFPFPQGVKQTEPNGALLAALYCKEASLDENGSLRPFSLAYLDGKP